MASQTINLPSSDYTESGSNIRWILDTPRPAIDAALAPPNVNRFLTIVELELNGRVVIAVDSTASGGSDTADLSSQFEESGGFRLQSALAGVDLTVELNMADTTEPYQWLPSNGAAVTAAVQAFHALPGTAQAAMITIFDIRLPTFGHLDAEASAWSYLDVEPSGASYLDTVLV